MGWCVRRVRARLLFLSGDRPTLSLQYPVSKISDIIATRSVIANPHKQQIPIRLRSGQALHSPFDSLRSLRVRSG